MDLYDDLDDVKVASASNDAASSKVPKKSSVGHPKSLTEQVDDLQAQVNRLQQENDNLKRSMGTLYRTAQAELARKDKEIASLREKIE